ncbi:hypothetical protein N7472_009728 [Penicillium cf. griseofulvum]|uniref:Zn(2)-C6 fungal-type domain-containing protein n=1 Tax=Penicillium cf. griseofulvum TaxID=2972120 RepID=A0A9W9ITM8_9EURO|nr:hypothetical protein N7472_009728 [Penicillium cf. griseofulvum]
MVGVPRSNGCSLCVKRRVKCDQGLPGCAKCDKYGQPCPGYERGFKFVTGKPYRDRRQPNPRNDKKDCPKSATSNSELDPEFICQTLAQREKPSSLISMDLNVVQHLCVLIDDFSQPYTPSPTHVVGIGCHYKVFHSTSFWAHYPEYPNVTICPISLWGSLAWAPEIAGNSRRKSIVSYILCGSTAVHLFTDIENPESWMKHAKGLSQLVRIRGPNRYNTELDITLLKAARGLIVMHSMFSGEECFLASDEWHDKMRQQYTFDLPPEVHNSIEVFFTYFTYAPNLVHKLYSLRHVDATSAEALQTTSEITSTALEMQMKLAIWYEQFSQIVPPPTETISSTGDELHPIILTYTDVNYATIYCGYYSYMVIIHEILKTCDYPGEHEAMVAYFRDQICKSVEYNSVGVMGPYRMGFPLRVAFEVADPVTSSWILNRLGQFSKIYAAAQPENYHTVL